MFKTGIKFFGWAVLAVAVIVLFKIVIMPIMFVNTVASSVSGVVSKTLDSNNVLENYEWFYDANATVESRKNQILAHTNLIKDADKDDRSRLNIERAAMQQSCRDLVMKYNANSMKLNKSLFKANNLPSELNINTCEVK